MIMNAELQLQAILAEYNDLRDEIKKRISQRTTLTSFMLGVVGASLGFVASSQRVEFLVVPPGLAIFLIYLIRTSYHITESISFFIRNQTELKLNEILGTSRNGNSWINWESWYREDKRQMRKRRWPIFLGFGWLLYLCSGAVLVLESETIFRELPYLLAYFLGYGIALALLTFQKLDLESENLKGGD